MPFKRSEYPKEWKEISRSTRERAGNRCEWCGVSNGAVGARDKHGEWHNDHDIHTMNSGEGSELFGEFPDMIRIVLTVAHLGTDYPDGRPGNKHDKSDCRPENLAALCQRCHLNYDREDHIRHATITRKRKQRERIEQAGQLAFMLE